MSFLSVIQSIGRALEKVVGVALPVVDSAIKISEPFIAILSPAAAGIEAKIDTLVVTAEMAITGAQQGALKHQTVAQIAVSELPLLQSVITQFGPNVKIPQAELAAVIDASAAGYNAIAALIAAIEAQNKSTAPVA